MGVAAADFDNDGWTDILMANGHLTPEIDTAKSDSSYRQRKLLYRNLRDGRFEDVTLASGVDAAGLRSSRGAAAADLYNDGRISVVVNELHEKPSLLVPEAPAPNHWIGINSSGPSRIVMASARAWRWKPAACGKSTKSAAAAVISRKGSASAFRPAPRAREPNYDTMAQRRSGPVERHSGGPPHCHRRGLAKLEEQEVNTLVVEEKYRDSFGATQTSLVALMFAFSVMSYFDRTIMSIAGPEIMKEFGIEPTQMGWVYSAFILGYAVFMIPGGDVADRLGPRNTLALMGLAAAFFTALTPLGGHSGLAFLGVVPLLIAIRCGLGIVSAPLYPACARMCSAWIPMVQRARVQAFIIAGSCVGGAVSPILFSWLMSLYKWRGSFYLSAVATAALALAWVAYVRRLPRGVEQSPGRRTEARSWRRLLLNRNLALLTFAYFTLGYFEYIFFYWIYYYFGEVRHTGFAQSARYTTVIFLVMLVMMPLGGWISDRLTRSYGPKFGRRAVPLIGLTMGAILLYLGVSTADAAPLCFSPSRSASRRSAKGHSGLGDRHRRSAGRRCGRHSKRGGNVGGFFSPVLTPLVAKYFWLVLGTLCRKRDGDSRRDCLLVRGCVGGRAEHCAQNVFKYCSRSHWLML
jgi:ACS family glucarate transporter-like MFS transporter